MTEQTRHHHEDTGPGPQAFGDIFAGGGEQATATVAHGPYLEQLPVTGMTVEEIRQQFGDRFDIDPDSLAVLDGQETSEDSVVRSGQMLIFMKRAGEKGLPHPSVTELARNLRESVRGQRRQQLAKATITIEEETVTASVPEGAQATMSVETLVERTTRGRFDTDEFVMPDGVKCLKSQGPLVVLVHESPPQVHSFRWIVADSPVPFGPEATYRTISIALPYLIVFAVFEHARGRISLSHHNECFFLNEPLRCLDSQELMFPALLNCSRFTPAEGQPLSWICTQHLDRRACEEEKGTNRRMRAGFEALMQTLLASSFNYSSEVHEGSSWYSETQTRKVDPRVCTVEDWEAATAKDSLFVLRVPWLKTDLSARKLIERIFRNTGASRRGYRSANDLARIVFNQKNARPGR